MRLTLPKITWPSWSRNKNGDNFYDVTATREWTSETSNLEIAQNHPILTPALLFVSKVFSQAQFHLDSPDGLDHTENHKILSLLNKPNQYQTKEDFLEALMFMKIAQGVCIVGMNKIIGYDEYKSMFILNKDLITFPDGFEDKKFSRNNPSIMNTSVIYDADGENVTYKIKDLLFFYDLPNSLDKNPFEAKSRIDGLRQTLINTKDSLIAKNIILKSNGKELISGKKEGFPLSPDEKNEIERIFNNGAGLSFSRKRGIVTKADVTWKSLHIALRDLGLDESVKVDGNIIYTALHIPKDILSLEAKKTTYNNFKESMVSYIQNETQSTLNSVMSVFNKCIDDPCVIRGDYLHLPIMQYILLEKYDVVIKQAAALRALLLVGIKKELALKMSGFDENTELGPMMSESNNENNGEQQQEEKRFYNPTSINGKRSLEEVSN